MAMQDKHFFTNGDEAIHLHSENGTAYELSVGNDGALTVTNEATGAVSGGGGGLPTGGAPHQQFVTDAEGKALWEDRLAYAVMGEDVILQETALTRVEQEGTTIFVLTEPLAAPLVEGRHCAVVYNGVAYNCPVQAISDGDVTMLALGNAGAALGGEDTGEPFVFALIPDALADQMPGVYAQVIVLDGADSVTIAITGVVEKVKTIDPKFLPAGGSGGGGLGSFYIDVDALANLNGYAYRDAALTDMLTYEQGCNAMRDGGIIRFASSAMPDMLEGYVFPAMLQMDTGARKIAVLVSMGGNAMMVDILFSDSVE